jgi:hypothetical protein
VSGYQATELGDWYQPARLARTRPVTIRLASVRVQGAHAAARTPSARRFAVQRTAEKATS